MEYRESHIQQQYDKFRKDVGLTTKASTQAREDNNQKSTAERVAFITSAQIVKPVHPMQLEDDKETMERLKRER